MNYYTASQRESSKRWDYTVQNGTRIRAVGYCRAYVPLTVGMMHMLDETYVNKYNEDMKPFIHKYHTDGHSTAEEACECYRQYLLDHHLKFFASDSEMHKCQICEAWCQGVVNIDYSVFYLCDAHKNRECVEKLFKSIRDIISSS